MTMHRPVVPPPPVAPRWVSLAEAVPPNCPWHGCAIAGVVVVSGEHDGPPIADVKYACGRVIYLPNIARDG